MSSMNGSQQQQQQPPTVDENSPLNGVHEREVPKEMYSKATAHSLSESEEYLLDKPRDDGLGDTGGPGSGIVADLRRKWPHYKSDWTDGLVFKSVAVILFLFLACMAPAIAFGGLMDPATGGAIGVVEMIFGTGIVGTLFAIMGGLPITIMGGTGPLLVFTQVLYQVVESLDLVGVDNRGFLAVYALTGLWAALFLFLAAIFNTGKYMRWCTRFTDDTFAALISTIFIYEALDDFFERWHESGWDAGVGASWAVLMFGTCWMTFFMKDLGKSTYFSKPVRQTISNFAPFASMVIFTGIAQALTGALSSEDGERSYFIELPDPEDGLFVPTQQFDGEPRGWLIDVTAAGNDWWIYLGTALPGFLASILIFLDQNITARILNNPDNKLEKGTAYHWDMLLLSLITAFTSIMGMPWLVAATVRALTHLQANAEYSTKKTLGSPSIIGLNDQRVTPLGIHVLILLSVFLIFVLQYVPLAVLGGIFLFMGLGSLVGNQFIDRLKLCCMEKAVRESPESMVSRVRKRAFYIFTFVQVVGLIVLWVVKQTDAAISFPLFILLLIPLRTHFLPRFIYEEEFHVLDSEEETSKERDEESGEVTRRKFSLISQDRLSVAPGHQAQKALQ